VSHHEKGMKDTKKAAPVKKAAPATKKK